MKGLQEGFGEEPPAPPPGARWLHSFLRPSMSGKSMLGLNLALKEIEAHEKAGGTILYLDMEGPIDKERLKRRLEGNWQD